MKYYTSQLQEDVKNIFKLNMQKKKKTEDKKVQPQSKN